MKPCNYSAIVVVLFGVSPALLRPGGVQAQEVLSVADLGERGDDDWSSAVDVNKRGVVVGKVWYPSRKTRAAVWIKGRTTDLGTLGGLFSEAFAVDRFDRVVGWSRDDTNRNRAFLWRDGEMVDLNDLIGGQSDEWELRRADDINRKGHIVGYGRFDDGERIYTRAFLLKLGRQNKVIHLGPFRETGDSWAHAVNDVGQVVGLSDSTGVLWDDGKIIYLGHLGDGGTVPTAINNSGQVVGHSELYGRRTHGFLWTKELGMKDLGTLGGSHSQAHAILDDGTIVGWADDSDEERRAFTWRDGVMTDINELLPFGYGISLTAAYGINGAGQIVGQGRVKIGEGDGAGSAGFIANKLCVNVKDVELECFRGDALQATVKTRLPLGSVISVEHPVDGIRVAKANARGRVKFEWSKKSDMQKVCVDGCPETCTTTECLPLPKKYLLVDLGTLPGGGETYAAAINKNGDVAGSGETIFKTEHAIGWRDGVAIDLGTLGGAESFASGINDRGQLVGSAHTVDEEFRAFLWEDGVMSNLGTLGGYHSSAHAVNDAGVVVGGSETSYKQYHAFVWQDGEMFDLFTLGGVQSSAQDVNSAGEVVGTAYNRNGHTRAFLWTGNGPLRDLGTFGGDRSRAVAINDSGTVVGTADEEEGGASPFLWTERDGMIRLDPENKSLGGPRDINNLGQVVGDTRVENGDGHAYLWQEGVTTDLNDLVPSHCAWDHLTIARGINDSGEITGMAQTTEREAGAFLMTHAYCGSIREFQVSCNRKNRLTARLNTTYQPGTVLTLSNNDGQSQCVIIDAVGRGKVRWRDQSGPREICVEQCRDLCESVDCP